MDITMILVSSINLVELYRKDLCNLGLLLLSMNLIKTSSQRVAVTQLKSKITKVTTV